jgi:hypothetical protein
LRLSLDLCWPFDNALISDYIVQINEQWFQFC